MSALIIDDMVAKNSIFAHRIFEDKSSEKMMSLGYFHRLSSGLDFLT
ncbi:hypothetical protein [Nostoc sp.]